MQKSKSLTPHVVEEHKNTKQKNSSVMRIVCGDYNTRYRPNITKIYTINTM